MLFLALLSLWVTIKEVAAGQVFTAEEEFLCPGRLIPMDVYFAVDASHSIDATEWAQQRVFISKLISNALEPNDRVGLTQWSAGHPGVAVEYTYADDVDAIAQGVLSLEQKYKSQTWTDEALEYTLQAMLAENTLPGRKKMMVLLTDGFPTKGHGPCKIGDIDYEGDTTVVQKFVDAGIEIAVLAIRPTPGADPAEYERLLSCLVEPSNNEIVVMDDFSSFDQYRDPTGGDMCVKPTIFTENPTPLPTPAPSPLPTPAPSLPAVTPHPTDVNGCIERTEPMDVYFAVDASASISETEWANQQFFLSQLVRFGLDHPEDRVGVISWSHTFVKQFGYDKSIAEVQSEVYNMNQNKGWTHTDEGINFAFDSMMQEQQIPGRKRMIILLTDGEPSCNPEKPDCNSADDKNPCISGDVTIPDRLEAEGIEFSILAINNGPVAPDFSKLSCLVEDPQDNIVVMDGFSNFDTYRDPTGGSLCVDPVVFTLQPTVAPTPLAPVPTAVPTDEFGCSERTQPLDVYFAIDASGSIQDDEWIQQLTFISQLIEFGLDHPEDRVGVISWSDVFVHQYSFQDSVDHIRQTVTNTVQVGSNTHTDKGINFAIEKLLAEPVIAGHKRMIILLTDGKPSTSTVNPCTNGDTTIPQRLADNDIDFSILAIGTDDFRGELGCLVDDEQEEIVIMDDFVSFDTYRDPTGGYLCVNPQVFTQEPTAATTPAPTCPDQVVEPASIFHPSCSQLKRKSCKKDLGCVRDGKKCFGKDMESQSCPTVKNQHTCNNLERCGWNNGQCEPLLLQGALSEATCKSEFCARYTWIGGSSQCDFDLARDGCGCKGLKPSQCGSDPRCQLNGCSCVEKTELSCDNLSVQDCTANANCLVWNGGCTKKCELGPNQQLPANMMLALDGRSGECYLQTGVEGGCGCTN